MHPDSCEKGQTMIWGERYSILSLASFRFYLIFIAKVTDLALLHVSKYFHPVFFLKKDELHSCQLYSRQYLRH